MPSAWIWRGVVGVERAEVVGAVEVAQGALGRTDGAEVGGARETHAATLRQSRRQRLRSAQAGTRQVRGGRPASATSTGCSGCAAPPPPCACCDRAGPALRAGRLAPVRLPLRGWRCCAGCGCALVFGGTGRRTMPTAAQLRAAAGSCCWGSVWRELPVGRVSWLRSTGRLACRPLRVRIAAGHARPACRGQRRRPAYRKQARLPCSPFAGALTSTARASAPAPASAAPAAARRAPGRTALASGQVTCSNCSAIASVMKRRARRRTCACRRRRACCVT